MFEKAGVLFLYTLTPLHPGSGSSVAAVDLPIQRERHTKFPMMQASGVKGALRDLAGHLTDNGRIEIVFGPETDRASEHGGALALTDARILLFPVRSVQGVFTWITCPAVIKRLERDLAILKATNAGSSDQALEKLKKIELPTLDTKARQASTPESSRVVLPANNQIILEDFCFQLPQDPKRNEVGELATWLADNALPDGLSYWKEKLNKDLVLLSDDDFREFVEMSTEVITRIKLGEMGTVDAGPWDEEHLPSETLLYSLALATKPKQEDKLNNTPIKNAEEVLNFLQTDLVAKAPVMQFGGDETVGKGLVRLRYFDGKGEEKKSGQQDSEKTSGGGGYGT